MAPSLKMIGNSGLETPPLILGGNVFAWTADRQTSFAVLDAFVSGGGRMIDTADRYSAWVNGHKGGESEELIGEWLKKRRRRDDVLIATKVGLLPGQGGDGLSPSRIAVAIDESLSRLNTDYVDVYYAHKDDGRQSLEAVALAFDRLEKAGKVRVLGASNFTEDRLSSALDIQKTYGYATYQLIQNHYNLLERPAYESGMRALCKRGSVGMVPYYGLASGYLTGKYRTDRDFCGSPRDAVTKTYHERHGPRVLAALDTVAASIGATVAQVALAWLAGRPGVVAPVASATSIAQVEELLGATELVLSDEFSAYLNDASET